jgi:hypothetical protein
MAWVDSEGFEPSLSRVRAGCASFALRAHGVIGGNRTRTPGVTDPCASLTRRPPCRCVAAAVRPEGIEPSSTAYRAAALPLCYGRRRTSRRAGDSNPQTRVAGHPLSRRAPGTCAGRTLQSVGEVGIEPTTSRSRTVRAAPALHPAWRKERESNPQGSSLIRFRDGCHHPLACPSRSCVGGSGGNRTHVLRFKRPVQRQHLLPTRVARMAPPLGVEPRPSALQADAQTSYARVGKWGIWRYPSSSTMQLSKR